MAAITGLAAHKEELGAPLCPCRNYEDKQAEVRLNSFCSQADLGRPEKGFLVDKTDFDRSRYDFSEFDFSRD